jgi:MinD-like ATPase involved in chromosome partitioning or flagellar assembly
MTKIISIHSYRGGTGKSNTVANLASFIASLGHKVGIIDTDLPSPGIHVPLGLNESEIKYTLNNFLWGRCEIEQAAYDITHVLQENKTEKSQLYLVPSSVKLDDISRVLKEGFDPDRLFAGLIRLKDKLELDYLFIDTHPGLNRESLVSLLKSNLSLVLLRPDQQDYQGTAVIVDIARKLKVQKMFLIVNKALTSYDFRQMRQEIQHTFNTPVIGIFAESEEMIRLGSKGIFWLNYPNHPISLVTRGIATTIMRS